MNRLLALISCLTLAGCGMPFTPDAFSTSPEALALRSIIDRMVSRDLASIQAQLDSRLVEPDVPAALQRTANAIPASPITKIEPVSWNVFVGTNQTRSATVAAEYTFADGRWILATAQLTGEPNAFRILQFNVVPLSAPLAQIHAFTFVGKSVRHLFFFLAAIMAPLVSLWGLVRCVRTKGLRRKWLWVIFVATGFISFTINWTSGAVHINPLAFNLFSAAFIRHGWLGPWMLTFCIPVGALIFLWRHRKYSYRVPTSD